MTEELEGNSEIIPFIPVLSVTILFLLQGARELIGTTYNFNLATMSINISILAILAFMTAILFPVLPGKSSSRTLLLIGMILAASRIVMAMGFDAGIHLLASFILVSSSILSLLLLANRAPSGTNSGEVRNVAAFSALMAVGLDMALRAAGGSFDISIYGISGSKLTSLAITLLLSSFLILGLFRICRMTGTKVIGIELKHGVFFGLALGMALFLYLAFSGYPNVSSGWTVAAPHTSHAVAVMSLLILLLLTSMKPARRILNMPFVPAAAGLALVTIFAALMFQPVGPVAGLLLPASILPLGVVFRNILAFDLSGRGKNRLSLGLFIAGFSFVAFALSSVLTLTWAHVPGTGFLKDAMGTIGLVSALVLFIVVLGMMKNVTHEPRFEMFSKAMSLSCAIILLSSLAFPLAYSTNLRDYAEPSPAELRIMTYNIHQGYGIDGKLDPWRLLATISEFDPDILVLQESETNRISSMNTDTVNWLAHKLGMHVYTGPPTGDQIYGLAMLSKHRIEDAQLYFLDSVQDQRAWFRCQITVGSMPLAVYGIHMGLSPEDRTSQSNEVIQHLARETMPFIMAGDFNTWPNETIYQNLTSVMEDAWVLAGNHPLDTSGNTWDSLNPGERIDYIFVSRDLSGSVMDCGVSTGQEGSDHLPVWVTINIDSP